VIAVLAVAAVALTRAGWRGEPAAEVDLGETLGEVTVTAQISESADLRTPEPALDAPEAASR
jgi:hypothetical protein